MGIKRRWRSFVLVTTASMVLLSGLSVGDLAVAHNFEETRSISLARRPTGRVKKGSRVTFYGRVKSAEPFCYRQELVELIRIGKGTVSSDLTDNTGEFSMRVRVRASGSYVARVSSTANGTHPHRHVCYGARSNVVRVRVRRR